MSTTISLAEVLPPEALAASEAPVTLGALGARAEAVVRPQSTEEVAATLRWAGAHGVGVLPVGSGARVSRTILEHPFVVLSTDRLTGIEIYEPADLTLTARAGTPFADVSGALGAHRQWLPFDPPHVAGRTLGGLVATGESGPVATGYGELRSHVLGATVVCGDGRILRLGGRVVKNVAGFDLLRPVVGSRGRLGVITSVCLRAFPLPAVDRLLLVRAPDVAGLRDVSRAVRTAPVLPASCVVWAPGGEPAGGGAALLVRLHGARPTVDAEQAVLECHAGVSFEQPEDAAALSSAVRDQAAHGALMLNLSLLPSELFEGLAAVHRHLGDVAVVADAYGGSARVATDERDAEAVARLRDDVEALGGALAARSPSLDADLGSRQTPEELELATRLERVFDPEGVFWPCRL